ncbi:MAG TPA: hypothetical protein VF169_26155 [Albitalea sp.]|uniref:hypothetical protein n=1 Tax=Piscinibacter sp. TaxID=1903157 RepID=UPI002ED61621
MKLQRLVRTGILAWWAVAMAGAASASTAPGDDVRLRVEKAAATLAADMARLCPAADPADQVAFDACRRGLYQDSQFKRSLQPFVLWGRQKDPKVALKDTKLTQFGPDVLSNMYVPLFMFNGKHTVAWSERESLYEVRLQTAFRNRLAPGQFPYPFWHEADKWSMYEGAREIILWWDPKADKIKLAQFTVHGSNPPIQVNTHVTQAAFDGKWMWTDAQGRTQPASTVFDGMLRADNPYIGKLDVAYKNLALKLREGQCFQCHVPNNPDGMKKLVLLQTPMHAASEIKRVLKAVREDTMPRDEFGIEQPLDSKTKAALLNEGTAFEKLLDLAKQWEASGPATAQRTTVGTADTGVASTAK